MISTRTIVLDTSVLAELMKPRPDMAVLRWTNAQPIGTLAVTSVSLAELMHAMLRMSDLSRSINLREALDEFVHDDLANRVLPFDDLSADYYAEFVWKREQAETPISMADAQIAATCRAYGVTLATQDATPYADLGITTIDPWTAPLPKKVEVPVLVPPPELDRNGKPIPPRRPGAARGGVGASRPPRQRRSRRSTTGAKSTPARAKRQADKAKTTAAEMAPVSDEESLARSQRAAERLRRHVAEVHETTGAAVARRAAERVAVAAAKRAAADEAETAASTPGRRGARLLGPLVDAAGREVERDADGRMRRREDQAPAEAKVKASPANGGGTSGSRSGGSRSAPKTPRAPSD